jgi:hypothetical protein
MAKDTVPSRFLPSSQSVSRVGNYFFLNEVDVNRENRRARELDCPTMRRHYEG